MKPLNTYETELETLDDTLSLGARLGAQFRGGEVVELVSDLGGGKTALVRGMARGLESDDQVMSPTFTVSRIYHGNKCDLHHFDFYRLNEPGVIAEELRESIDDPKVAVVIEWSDIVSDVLPSDRLRINITVTSETARHVTVLAYGPHHAQLLERLS
ncbi:MAG: tRNA (adenosine(37)-N6)-threonylcarbamoyltransferase complex ATPase subunit type 1 TsaE [Candidatus Saccharimonadales bacterium]